MGKIKSNHRIRPSPPRIEELEPRILYSADFAPEVVPTLGSSPVVAEHRIIDLETEIQIDDAQAATGEYDIIILDESDLLPEDTAVLSNSAEQFTYELVIVDTATPDYQQLIDDVLAQNTNANLVEVVLLDSSRDGIEQLTNILSGYSGLDAVHLISHGSDGEVTLGNTVLNSETLLEQAANIKSWSSAFSGEGDFLLYGCNLAITQNGQALVNSLAELTGADVAASDDITGSAELGGDWELEYQAGAVEANAIINPNLNLSWVGALNTTDNLVGHWKFDEGSGTTANDSSTNSNAGTLTDSPIYTTGNVGSGALDFGGNYDRVVVPDNVSLDFGSGDFSVSFWFKSSQTASGSHRLVGDTDGGNGFIVYSNMGTLSFYVTDGTNSSITSVNGAFNDNWRHFVGTRTGNDFSLYIDNVEYDSDTSAVGNINNTNTLRIGASSDSTNEFDGLMDDVRLYNRALTTSDISELFSNPNTAPVAANDSVTTNQNTPVSIDVVGNDSDPESDSLTVLQTDDPDHGSTVNNHDGTVTYTPDNNYSGTDDFDYLITDVSGTTHFWGLEGDGEDSIGSANGTLQNGPTTVTGTFGSGLSFDESDDYVDIPDFTYTDEFSLSFKFKVDDNSGNYWQYLYNHGDINSGQDSLAVFLVEDGRSNGGMLQTYFRDVDDGGSNDALEVDISATGLNLIGDLQWHTYTLTVGASGSEVFIDGVSRIPDSTRGGDSFNPAGDLSLGRREVNGANRYYGGQLDSVQIFNRTLSSSEVAKTHSGGTDSATASITVNGAPTNITLTQATPAAINNPGFESLTVGDGADSSSIPDWADLVDAGTWNPNSTGYADEAPEGENVGFIDTPTPSSGGTFSQVLAETFQANRSYTLTAMVGEGSSTSGWQMRLYAGDQLLGSVSSTEFDPPNDEFIKATLHLDADTLATYSAKYNQALKIEFFNTGDASVANAHFDDVKLEYTDISVAENSTIGTVVADVSSVTDPDVGDTHTYTLTDDAGGRFAIHNTTGMITVLDGSLLDYETSTSHNITIQATDGGLTYDEIVTLQVSNISDEAPLATNDHPFLTFDGVDDFVSIADHSSLQMTNTMTMEARIKPDTNAIQIVVNKEGEYEFAVKDGKLQWAIAKSDNIWNWRDTGYSVTQGEWLHVAVSYENGTVKTYANGSLVDTHSIAGPIGDRYPAWDDLQIGGRQNGNPEYFNGQIADVRIWNTARSQAEIHTNQNQVLTGAETGLVGYWRLDEGTGTTVTDSSSQSNTGTLGGGSASQEPTWAGYTIDEDNILTVTAPGLLQNDFDPDGDALTVNTTPVTDVSNGTLVLSISTDGSFTYTPNADFNGVDSFTYQISDGNGGTDTATVNILVNPVNDAPVAANNTVTTTEDTSYTFSATDFSFTDVDGDTLASIQITVLETVGALQLSGANITLNQVITKADIDAGNLSFVPVADANGASYDSFAFSVNDGTADSASSYTLTVDVTNINDAPVLSTNNTIDFNDYNVGTLAGQNGWTIEKFSTSAEIQVTAGAGVDGSQALIFTGSGSGAGNSASLVGTGGLPDMSSTETLDLQWSIKNNYWGSQFAVAYDANSDGQILRASGEQALSVGINDVNKKIIVTLPDDTTIDYTHSFSAQDWIEFRWQIGLTANSDQGSGTLEFRNLSASQTA